MTTVIDTYHSFDRDEHGRHQPSVVRIWIRCVDCGATTKPYYCSGAASDYDKAMAHAEATGLGWSYRLEGNVRRDVCASCLLGTTHVASNGEGQLSLFGGGAA